MRRLLKNVTFVVLIACSSLVLAQPYRLSPSAPEDKPLNVNRIQLERLEAAIQPLIKQAKATYPEAKRRFLAGLPKGETFFVTAVIRDRSGLSEQAFIAVQNIEEGNVSGRVASGLSLIKGYKAGDPYRLPETEIIDWLISKPDGTEEGNLVGKFLDTYRPQ
jgi:hypothetical protein